MKYAYFPGCSLEGIAESYSISAKKTIGKLGCEFVEIEDWNCCGATAYFNIDEILAHTLSARNLAIAEKEKMDVVAPCSACYKNMYSTNYYLKKDSDLREHINFALKEDELEFTGKNNVRHLIDVYIKDIGLDELKKKVEKPLDGLRVAPYYGCQLLRPKTVYSDVERPQFFENLLTAIGAVPVNYQLKTTCCGGSLVISKNLVALKMIRNLLKCAVDNKADLIVTTCPLCQVNLECYQKRVNRIFKTNFSVPILYFTQLLGIALGFSAKEMLIGSEFIPITKIIEKLKIER